MPDKLKLLRFLAYDWQPLDRDTAPFDAVTIESSAGPLVMVRVSRDVETQEQVRELVRKHELRPFGR